MIMIDDYDWLIDDYDKWLWFMIMIMIYPKHPSLGPTSAGIPIPTPASASAGSRYGGDIMEVQAQAEILTKRLQWDDQSAMREPHHARETTDASVFANMQI